MTTVTSDYRVVIGGLRANVVSVEEKEGNFVVNVQPPPLPAGLHSVSAVVKRMGAMLFNNSQLQDTTFSIR